MRTAAADAGAALAAAPSARIALSASTAARPQAAPKLPLTNLAAWTGMRKRSRGAEPGSRVPGTVVQSRLVSGTADFEF